MHAHENKQNLCDSTFHLSQNLVWSVHTRVFACCVPIMIISQSSIASPISDRSQNVTRVIHSSRFLLLAAFAVCSINVANEV